jgi:hypothetical protein
MSSWIEEIVDAYELPKVKELSVTAAGVRSPSA